MEELINKYKITKLSQRALLVFFLSLSPSAYYYMNSVGLLESDLESAFNEKEKAKQEFEKAKQQKSSLPKIEAQLAKTQTELEEASKRLPDQFVMDKILESVAALAKESGVDLLLFHPKNPTPSNTAYKYAKLPIEIQMLGTYSQLGVFFDKIVHLKLLVHIKNIKFYLTKKNEKSSDNQVSENMQYRIRSSASLFVYRTLTSREQSAIEGINQDKNKEKEKEKENKENKKPENDAISFGESVEKRFL